MMDARKQQPNSDQPEEQLQDLSEGNLRNKTEYLFTKVDYLENRLCHLADSNTDLSCRLVQSEEEKLKVSKELVEEKLQTNKLRAQFGEETFELKNKMLTQDGVITELELERNQLLSKLQSAETLLKVGERSGQDLSDEYAALRKNYCSLAEAHNKETVQSEELSSELLALARAQDALRKQLEEQKQNVETTTQGLHGELERVQALITRVSQNRVKPEDLAAFNNEQQTMNKNLLGNQDEIKDMLEKMKTSYEEQQKRLEERVVAMGKEHQENKRAIRNSSQELSVQSAALMFSQSQMKEVEEENSRLQLQVKRLNEEFRARLVCYLQDLAGYIDAVREDRRTSDTSKWRAFVDGMLQDVRSSYRVREEQLASAATAYKKRLQKITKNYQALLTAYRVKRDQILAKPWSGLDPGPPEAHFSLEDAEPRDETEKELQHLRQDKARLQASVDQISPFQMAVVKTPAKTESHQETGNLEQSGEESISDMSQQLREVTDSMLVDFEEQLALLVTGATVAEVQVLELQDYIDNHLGRYKEEILHLCRQHGVQVTGRCLSATSSLH